MPEPVYDDYFQPRFDPKPDSFAISNEQLRNIKGVLSVACSDSRFAEKAYAAIVYILVEAGMVEPIT